VTWAGGNEARVHVSNRTMPLIFINIANVFQQEELEKLINEQYAVISYKAKSRRRADVAAKRSVTASVD